MLHQYQRKTAEMAVLLGHFCCFLLKTKKPPASREEWKAGGEASCFCSLLEKGWQREWRDRNQILEEKEQLAFLVEEKLGD
ncbi:MAG: hypothetical protein MJ077_07935 [Oscillospiraceae bacterium]|nr:hypothetical protein [Oscillospiraceae bacterium]